MDFLSIKLQALSAINEAQDLNELENIRIKYLSKNGIVNQEMKKIVDLPQPQRSTFGQTANQVKLDIEKLYQQKVNNFSKEKSTKPSFFDITIPGRQPKHGHLHLVTQAIKEISDIFAKLGFERARYPEVEWDYYAFESLNMPADHPARDEWETLFVNQKANPKYGKIVLTPHTSNGQVREMLRLNSKPPIRMINISKTYRRQQDITHSIMFHQFEGLVVDQDINISHLKGTLDYFVKKFYGSKRQTRLRPFHFQFTEPSFEIDINCAICHGTGMIDKKKCKTCKQGWLELGGAGFVHPNVLKAGGINPNQFTGFAFGWGVERVYMMRSNIKIDDIRTLYENDIRFLNQF